MVKPAQKKYWKMRQQARLIVANVGASLFLKAQNNTCPICQLVLKSNEITVDHVWPLYILNENYGNIFLTHHECNQDKADREPTEFEIQMLDQINSRLGYDPETYRYQCRQSIVSKYHKTVMWVNELRGRGGSRAEIERVELKLMILEEQVGHLVDGLINKMIII